MPLLHFEAVWAMAGDEVRAEKMIMQSRTNVENLDIPLFSRFIS
jgi:hypothetical protein